MDVYDQYQSPYSWRYGSIAMRKLWSELAKRRLWRRIWVALAEIQSEYGIVTQEQVADLQAHIDQIDIDRALEIEAETHHDVMAEVLVFAEQCQVGGGIIHLGMTSMDVVDNAEALRIRDALQLVINQGASVLLELCQLIEKWSDTPIMGYTHLQPAEPTTLGYRLALYTQDLYEDWRHLQYIRGSFRAKGLKGAVGTRASYKELFAGQDLDVVEERFSAHLGIKFADVTSQTYPRKQEYDLISTLAGVGATLYKLAFDIRFLQTPSIGEVAEPFRTRQVGSSAMPFKRNPIQSEKIDSLARLLAQFPRVAWDNAAHSLLERTLDDSGNRRTILPESFLIVDELLSVSVDILMGLEVNSAAIERNLAIYAPFAAQEALLMTLVKAGADRQEMHAILRKHALAAWEAVQRGETNPLNQILMNDPQLKTYLSSQEIQVGMQKGISYTGDAAYLARKLASRIQADVKTDHGLE
jgi:adenylosuccinate lyase